MPDRVPCCVPFCRRTIAKEKLGAHREWICQKHWPLVSRNTKARKRSIERKARKVIRRKPQYREYWKLPPGSPERMRAVAMWRSLGAVWEKCKVEAIETAAGIRGPEK